MLQVEPEKHILRGYLNRVAQNKRAFTPREKERLLEILRERGDTFPDSWETWSHELTAHHCVIKARRDRAFRLIRLSGLGLKAEDRAGSPH
jgi:hypothetical protein